MDKSCLNNFSDYIQKQKKDIKSSWHAPIYLAESSKYTITHEMGHVLEECLFEKLRKDNKYKNSIYSDLAIKVRKDVEQIVKNKYTKPRETATMNISRYSMKNSMEWFAETFTNLILAEHNPTPVAMALNDYIRSFE